MDKYKATATFFLDKRRANSDSKFPIKLTIYQRPNKKRYSTEISLSEEEWNRINGLNLKDENLKRIKLELHGILAYANKIIEKLKPFTFEDFESNFFYQAPVNTNQSVEKAFDKYINELASQGRIGTRSSYNTTKNSLLQFQPKLLFTDITPEFLIKYEDFMQKQGKSPSTVGIYLRQLRSIFNRAISEGIVKQEQYPFKKFEIPSSRNVKKALNDEQLERLLKYLPNTDTQQKAYDFWVLSYLSNGMNMTDILHLKKVNLEKTFLYFNRQKTIRTKKRDLRPIKVPLHERALSIINRWRCNNKSNIYLFPILETDLSPVTIKNRTQKFIKLVNQGMEQIRLDLKIETKIGTYVARHSFATRLMRKGASTQYIKDSLGHSSVAVTDNYLGDFGDLVKNEFSVMLTDFS
ncbi:site-specific integrase [Sediminibacterium salmoneum]|uniref:site-specific integrase n=1 Tax=Sediminibacterium salmoneum TaxID=426421 RepID=UPI000479E2B3|nr:site-specific integrase [Sediminibacterium salmoneum]